MEITHRIWVVYIGPMVPTSTNDQAWDSTAAEPSQQRKTIAVVVSTMRSGSTLLKALLAEGDDVSNLPEVNFQRFQGSDAYQQIARLDARRIIVLKRPAWYQELRSYPQLPRVDDLRCVLLVRDVYETVLSLRKMTLGRAAAQLGPLLNGFLVNQYWYRITSTILRCRQQMPDAAQLVRYEDLVRSPVDETARLFSFLGSVRTAGTSQYHPPDAHSWKWGRDDGSDNIKSLQVQSPRDHGYRDRKLLACIRSSDRVGRLREALRYEALPS